MNTMLKDIFNNQNFWTVIGVFIALLSLYYAYKTYNQKALIELYIGTDQQVLRDPSLNLTFEIGYSQFFSFMVSLHNLGNKNANSINLIITFNSEVKINSLPTSETYWSEKNIIPNYRVFHYSNDKKIHPPNTNYSVGSFEISIPLLDQVESGFYFVANGLIEGDFERSCFLVLYNLQDDIIVIKHFSKRYINYGNNDWNLMVLNKK